MAGPLTAGSLCSGYGGLDLAVVAVTGARLAWCAETDRYAAAVLAHHWPGVPNLGDITALDWATVPPVDLVTAGGRARTSPTPALALAFATYDPATSTWKTSPRSAPAASRKSSPAWPRSGMTRNGYACALPAPEPRTAATACSSSPPGPAQPGGSRLLPAAITLLPTPMAGDFGADKSSGPLRPSGARRQTGLPDVIVHRLTSHGHQTGTGEPGEGRLLPTPDTGCSPNGHGRRGGRPGNGHQSGHGLDAAATALSRAPASQAAQRPIRWGEYEPAIRRWEEVLGYPAPPPAELGPSGRPRVSAAFAEWMMGLSIGVKCSNSAFLQFRTCLFAVSRPRRLSRTCLGAPPGCRPIRVESSASALDHPGHERG
jgi:DNA (cytosine-5)-methyltransferase 1